MRQASSGSHWRRFRLHRIGSTGQGFMSVTVLPSLSWDHSKVGLLVRQYHSRGESAEGQHLAEKLSSWKTFMLSPIISLAIRARRARLWCLLYGMMRSSLWSISIVKTRRVSQRRIRSHLKHLQSFSPTAAIGVQSPRHRTRNLLPMWQ